MTCLIIKNWKHTIQNFSKFEFQMLILSQRATELLKYNFLASKSSCRIICDLELVKSKKSLLETPSILNWSLHINLWTYTSKMNSFLKLLKIEDFLDYKRIFSGNHFSNSRSDNSDWPLKVLTWVYYSDKLPHIICQNRSNLCL